ncbi:MAG: ferredoxin [Bacilli bacterium]|nr:ferredoxin [Bacilli bacterium]
MKTKVNSEKCIGCGNCVALTESKIFDFNEEGLAEAIVETVPEEDEELVTDAKNQCPTDAIIIE